jgi:hypothetical protein
MQSRSLSFIKCNRQIARIMDSLPHCAEYLDMRKKKAYRLVMNLGILFSHRWGLILHLAGIVWIRAGSRFVLFWHPTIYLPNMRRPSMDPPKYQPHRLTWVQANTHWQNKVYTRHNMVPEQIYSYLGWRCCHLCCDRSCCACTVVEGTKDRRRTARTLGRNNDQATHASDASGNIIPCWKHSRCALVSE